MAIARQVNLLKQIVLLRISEVNDVRDSLQKFIEAVDRRCDARVSIPDGLLLILLYRGTSTIFVSMEYGSISTVNSRS